MIRVCTICVHTELPLFELLEPDLTSLVIAVKHYTMADEPHNADMVLNLMSELLLGQVDSRMVAAAAFEIYTTAAGPDIRFLEMAISCMESFMNTIGGLADADELITLSFYLHKRYMQLQKLQDLDECIAYTTAACEIAQRRPKIYPQCLNNLGYFLSNRYERTGNLQDLEAAIARSEAAVEAIPVDHPDRAAILNNLGNRFSSRYDRTGNLQDLEAAIAQSRAAVEATPVDHPDRAAVLNNLGGHLGSRYDRTGNPQDLEAAIAQSQAAVGATPVNHPDRAGILGNLGNRFSSRYKRTGNLQDLETAIARSEEAVEAIPVDHPDRAGILGNLGYQFGNRYKRTGNLQDLEAAIARLEAAVEATPEDHPERAGILSNLGDGFRSRYKRTGNLQDLESAIAQLEEAVEATPKDHPERAERLNTLGCQFGSRYERTGNLQDLGAAIARLEAAVEATPEDHPGRARNINNIGCYFSRRYERTGNLQDLETAITRLEAAVEATPEDHPERARGLNNLGYHFSRRYRRTGNPQDLETAIAQSEEAVEATPEDHPERAGRLSNLGCHFGIRYERTGNLQDLEAAIARLEEAAEAIPADHPDRAVILSNLGSRFSNRYERTGNLQDLEAAIAQLEAAVEATPINHPDRAAVLNNLGGHLGSRYDRTGNPQDLEAAIAQSQAAVGATPVNHPDRAGKLSNLGNHFRSRYDRTGNPQDLEAAIAQSEAAVEATPVDHPGRAGILNNLGNCFSSRYECTGNLQDLEAAIAQLEEAVEAIPVDHPDRAGILNNLGMKFMSYSYAAVNPAISVQVIQQSFDAIFASWSSSNGHILTRLQAAFAASHMLVFNPWIKDLSKACSLLYDSIHLMPLATSRSLEREDQQHILGQLTGLASFAAAVSLEAGQSPFEALRLLELGRGVTNGQLLDYRSDISDLIDQHPTLARKFDSIRSELDSQLPSTTESSDISIDKRIQIQQTTIRRRNEAAKDLDATLQEIRQQPGFKNFLRPETKEYFCSAAKDGPIVVLNVTELRSDAILITKEEVTSVPLPGLSHDLVVKYFGSSTTMESGSENRITRALLCWLWKAAVQPVLERLGCFQSNISSTARPDSDHLPRIWWIGVGLMAKAPIHAAGKYNKGSQHPKMSTLQYCIPSYTSTIRALLYSRSRERQLNTQSQLDALMGSTLIVTMPTTPGAGSLDGVNQEADEIKHSLRGFSTVKILQRPSAECVLQLLPSYSITHFACHGLSTINPADSHLLLIKQSISHDGACTKEVDRLRVKDIAAMKLPTARLAYLSACSTANSTNSKLVDEVTHIVSSFHIAGFIHVIGTLWPSEDEACQNMAMDFYSSLRSTNDVAVSYRNAIIKLRASKPSQLMYWAPFIHFGA